jgi:hypothetical protein
MVEGGSRRRNRAADGADLSRQRRERRVVKPEGWPRYMIEKRLGSGRLAYYWNPPGRDIEKGFTLQREALGPEYGPAVERSDLLNKHLDDWRAGRDGAPVEESRRGYGTVAWLIDRYVKSPRFLKVSERARYEYRRALKRVENMPTKTGGVVADLPVASITPAAVDKIYDKLQIGPRGKRVRQANLSVDIARRAWDVVRRISPSVVPAENPWRGVERNLTKKTKPAATRNEAYALAASLKTLGEPHLGAAALICFEWLQRPERVLAGDITWADYRPGDRGDAVQIRHHKTGVKGWLPLQDSDGAFYPELEAYLSDLPRLGLPIVLTAGRRGPPRPYALVYAQRRVREAREAAKLGSHVTLDACRHGGMTELGDAELTEQGVMSLSMHKTPQAARLYVKRTEQQRSHAARKRRQWVDANEAGARVRMKRQTKSQNGGAENA